LNSSSTRHAQRRREGGAEERAGGAVELVAADAAQRRHLVAGNAAEVPLHAHGALRADLDVAREGAQLARPAGAVGRDGRHAQQDGLVGARRRRDD
jgi:hypothetical protein